MKKTVALFKYTCKERANFYMALRPSFAGCSGDNCVIISHIRYSCSSYTIDEGPFALYFMCMNKKNILNRRFKNNSYTNVTLKLVIINALIYLLTSYVYPKSVYYLAMIPSFVLGGYIWQPFTYMFVHGGFSHLLFNMLSLYLFGTMVEQRVGSREFLLFYLLTGLFSGIISFISYLLAGTNVILVGASGAIYGVMLMFAVFYPYARVFVFGLIPLRAPMLVILYTGIELYSQVFSRGGNIAHLTHLSGLLFAYLYCVIRMKINPIDVFKRTR